MYVLRPVNHKGSYEGGQREREDVDVCMWIAIRLEQYRVCAKHGTGSCQSVACIEGQGHAYNLTPESPNHVTKWMMELDSATMIAPKRVVPFFIYNAIIEGLSSPCPCPPSPPLPSHPPISRTASLNVNGDTHPTPTPRYGQR